MSDITQKIWEATKSLRELPCLNEDSARRLCQRMNNVSSDLPVVYMCSQFNSAHIAGNEISLEISYTPSEVEIPLEEGRFSEFVMDDISTRFWQAFSVTNESYICVSKVQFCMDKDIAAGRIVVECKIHFERGSREDFENHNS